MLFKFLLLTLLNLTKTDNDLTENSSDKEIASFCYKDNENSRKCKIASDMDLVIQEHSQKLPFSGPKAKEATGLALLSIANHESGFQKKVQDCEITGDRSKAWMGLKDGYSVSLFQLHQGVSHNDLYLKDKNNKPKKYSRKEICSDNKLATRLSLHVLLRHPKYPTTMFYSYAGNDGKPSKAGKELYNQWFNLMNKNKFSINRKDGVTWVDQK